MLFKTVASFLLLYEHKNMDYNSINCKIILSLFVTY